MVAPFNIFKAEVSSRRWTEVAAADLERAKAGMKVLSASSPGKYIILNQTTGEKISIKSKTKRILFQIGYDEKGLNARTELLRRFGHEVISVTHNEATKVVLSSFLMSTYLLSITDQPTSKKRGGRLAESGPSENQNCGAENPSKGQFLGADYEIV
jgi:hypothetical protein